MLTWNNEDTIVAIATGGAAQRGIVRLSGPEAIAVASRLSKPSHRTSISSRPGNVTENLLTAQSHADKSAIELEFVEIDLGEPLGSITGWRYLWRTSKSYTGQASAEFHLLGSLPILEGLLQQCCRLGARVAQPGEFTMRSFLAGRLDLTQAEAVLGVINARGEKELQQALHQLAGGLSRPLAQLRADLINALAHLEAGLDFVDEDIEFITATDLKLLLSSSLVKLREVLGQIKTRALSTNVPKVILIGRPNAGKSSLLNALSETSTAIVSPQRGTTRDYITVTLDFESVTLELVDTAGLDASLNSEIDSQSQERTRAQLQEAALAVFVIDGTAAEKSELDLFAEVHRLCPFIPWLIVINKADLWRREDIEHHWQKAKRAHLEIGSGIPIRYVSASVGDGIGDLRQWLKEEVLKLTVDEGMSMLPATANRCRDSLERCGAALEAAIEMTGEIPLREEFIAAEIRLAMEELGWIAGEVYTDDLLDRIFSQFCIGK